MRKTRLGFTLIELLVVIAIIAILAAILFPVFFCPTDPWKKSNKGSYGINPWLVGPPPSPPFPDPLRTTALKLDELPNRAQPLPDSPNNPWKLWKNVYVLDEWDGPNEDKDQDGILDCYQWHGNGTNILLNDGRVQWIKGYDYVNGKGSG